jgi:hypothetical protein
MQNLHQENNGQLPCVPHIQHLEDALVGRIPWVFVQQPIKQRGKLKKVYLSLILVV